MMQQVLTQFPWPWLPSLALVIFFVFFVLLIFRVRAESQKEILNSGASLPLHDGEKV